MAGGTKKHQEKDIETAKQDPDFRQELIVEATNAFLGGDIDTGKRLIRDYLNATEAIPSIAGELKQNEKRKILKKQSLAEPTEKNYVLFFGKAGTEKTLCTLPAPQCPVKFTIVKGKVYPVNTLIE